MAGIDIDGGGIDMYPEPTRSAITAFGQAAAEIHENFDRRIGEIAGLDSQLGKGPLGRKASVEYNGFVDKVRPEMDNLKPETEERASGGLKIVDRYVEQDRVNQQIMNKLKPPTITST